MPNIPDNSRVEWKKATASMSTGECIEVAALPDGTIAMRDSKRPDGGVLFFTRGEFDAFVRGIQAGEFHEFR